MLIVYTGTDTVAVRAKAHEHADTLVERGATLDRVEAEACTPDLLRDRIGAQSLFERETPEVLLIDTPSEKAGALDAVLAYAGEMAESPNIFILLEGRLLAAPAKKLKAAANEFHEVKAGAAPERFNVFALADALSRRDKKSLWVLLAQARHAGLSAEEVAGTLFWQLKVMRLAERTKSAEEADLKPFVYSKAKRALAKFTPGELDQRSRMLISLYHDARLGLCDMELSLERWVLEV